MNNQLIDHKPLLSEDSNSKSTSPKASARKSYFFEHVPVISYEKNEKHRWNNVYTFFVQKSLFRLILNLSLGSMYDAYTFLLFNNSNSWVGYISGATGAVTLIAAIPIGVFVDIWNRELICKIACLLLLISTVIGVFSIPFDFVLGLFAFSIVCKVSLELAFSAGTTLFADSLSIRERTRYFILNETIVSIASAFGPFISVVYFLCFSNQWELPSLRLLLSISTAICLPAMAITCYRLKNINPHMIDSPPEKLNSITSSQSSLEEYQKCPKEEKEEGLHEITSTLSTDSSISEPCSFESQRFSQMSKLNKLVPYFTIFSTITISFGTGMLIKFLPLFFKEEFGFSPLSVALLLTGQAIALAVSIQTAKQIAPFLGRPLTSFILSFSASLLLLGLAHVHNKYVGIIVFILRGGFQNAASPIDQSLISDYTRSKNRGKWNSAFSFTQFLWSGSALMGGLISDASGYRMNFKISAVFYLLGAFVYFPNLFCVLADDRPKFYRSRQNSK